MTEPLNEEDARDKITTGSLIKRMVNSTGYIEVYKPFLMKLLNDADAKCHDFKLREDRGKYAVVEYNTIKKVLAICDEHIENMKSAMEYCRDNNITW